MKVSSSTKRQYSAVSSYLENVIKFLSCEMKFISAVSETTGVSISLIRSSLSANTMPEVKAVGTGYAGYVLTKNPSIIHINSAYFSVDAKRLTPIHLLSSSMRVHPLVKTLMHEFVHHIELTYGDHQKHNEKSELCSDKSADPNYILDYDDCGYLFESKYFGFYSVMKHAMPRKR